MRDYESKAQFIIHMCFITAQMITNNNEDVYDN